MSFLRQMLMLGGLSPLMMQGIPLERRGFHKRASSRGKKMMKNPPNRTGWFQRHAIIVPMPITERMLMRHGWYRRKLRKEGVKLDAGAKNSMVLR